MAPLEQITLHASGAEAVQYILTVSSVRKNPGCFIPLVDSHSYQGLFHEGLGPGGYGDSV